MIQLPPLIRITFGQYKSDTNNRMIQLADMFCVLFIYNGPTIFDSADDSIIRDPIKRRALHNELFGTVENLLIITVNILHLTEVYGMEKIDSII
jgi:hypothetical protein